MTAGGNRAWLSVHVYIDHGIYTPGCDRVLLDVVEPLVRQWRDALWIDRHFFIRYGEGGPHVRLRVHGTGAALETQVWPAIRDRIGAGSSGVTRIARIPYEPELGRYGGRAAIGVAERVFEVSSEAAYALLAGMDGEGRSSRLGKALLGMAVLLRLVHERPEDAARFAEAYEAGYLRSLDPRAVDLAGLRGTFQEGYARQSDVLRRYVQEVWSRMSRSEALTPALDAYARDLAAALADLRKTLALDGIVVHGTPARDWDAAVRGIVPSYVHMMNNRLGVTIGEEVYLAHLISSALGDRAAVTATPASGGGESR